MKHRAVAGLPDYTVYTGQNAHGAFSDGSGNERDISAVTSQNRFRFGFDRVVDKASFAPDPPDQSFRGQIIQRALGGNPADAEYLADLVFRGDHAARFVCSFKDTLPQDIRYFLIENLALLLHVSSFSTHHRDSGQRTVWFIWYAYDIF
jgi:hypothetical protein